MRNLLELYRPVHEAPDANAQPSAAAPAAPAAPPGATPPAQAPAAPGAADPNAPPVATPPGDALYRPEGLPDTMIGKSDRETLDRVAKSFNELRAKDAQRQAPKEFGEYSIGDVGDHLKPYFGNLEKDPVWDSVRKQALEAGIPVSGFQKFVSGLVGEFHEAGLLADVVDAEAERSAMLPDAAKHLTPEEQKNAINARIQGNIDFVEKVLVERGLPKDVAEYAVTALGDRAAGQKFFEFVSQALTGSQVNPLTAGGNAQGVEIDYSGPEWNPNHPQYNREKAEAHLAALKAKAGALSYE
jgi:hypothetical protein